MLKRKPYTLAMLIVGLQLAVLTSTADDPQPAAGAASLDLLDRGSAAGADRAIQPKTHASTMSAVLFNMFGVASPSPGVMTVGVFGPFAPPAPGMLYGYFFLPGIDFPATSWGTFFVTGAYAFVGPSALMAGAPILGAGAGVPPISAGMMWAIFPTAPGTAVPMAAPGMVFSAMFPHTPAAGIMVPPMAAVACGVDPTPIGGAVGALTAGPGGAKPLSAFTPPPGDASFMTLAPAATYVVGCFVEGATVPVELQAFGVE